MSIVEFEANLDLLETCMGELKVSVSDDSPFASELAIAREYLADMSLPEDERVQKWKPRAIEWQQTMIGLERLTKAVAALQNQPKKKLREILRDVVSGSVRQDFAAQAGKDKLYELEMAYVFQHAGFDVLLREPDIAVSGNGLAEKLGVACKYPSSWNQVQNHIGGGYWQITKQGLRGFVSIGMDLLLLNDRPKVLDFREESDPAQVAQEALTHGVKQLVDDRARDYPSEKPADGLLLSLRIWGAHGKPASITGLTALAMQCGESNPIHGDLRLVVDAVNASRD